MRIALIVSPFIAVPPDKYGGTELFVAHLSRGLHARGHKVIVYANGDSRLPCEVRFRYPHAQWPISDFARAQLDNLDHTAWAMHDARSEVDIIHLNDVAGVPLTPFCDTPAVVTLHHPHEEALSAQYNRYPDIDYVAIGEWQVPLESMPKLHVVHHGLPLDDYPCCSQKEGYAAFLGRLAPCKGAHLAIEVARRAGVDLRLAGEIQPIFDDYWRTSIAPALDNDRITYVGEADHARKVALLSRAKALLFPIQWKEPFGLVMIEAMACGTPVLAFAGGAVEEIVRDGVNGWICRDVEEMAERLRGPLPSQTSCRDSVREQFDVNLMVERYIAIYEQALERSLPASSVTVRRGGAWKI